MASYDTFEAIYEVINEHYSGRFEKITAELPLQLHDGCVINFINELGRPVASVKMRIQNELAMNPKLTAVRVTFSNLRFPVKAVQPATDLSDQPAPNSPEK